MQMRLACFAFVRPIFSSISMDFLLNHREEGNMNKAQKTGLCLYRTSKFEQSIYLTTRSFEKIESHFTRWVPNPETVIGVIAALRAKIYLHR